MRVDLDWHVCLTDADLLQLASPHMEKIIIHKTLGWGIGVGGGRITLTGLVQLLRRCPSLNDVCLAIDTATFTEIPEGVGVSFPPRQGPAFNFVDSYILPEFVPGVVSVFTTLELDGIYKVWDRYDDEIVGEKHAVSIWAMSWTVWLKSRFCRPNCKSYSRLRNDICGFFPQNRSKTRLFRWAQARTRPVCTEFASE